MRGDVNLCTGERSVRFRKAMAALGVAIALVIVLAELEAAPIWWLAMAIPLYPTALLIAQAYTGVCVFHAREGTRSIGGVIEPILDPRKRTHVQARARGVLATAIGLGTTATALVMALALVR